MPRVRLAGLGRQRPLPRLEIGWIGDDSLEVIALEARRSPGRRAVENIEGQHLGARFKAVFDDILTRQLKGFRVTLQKRRRLCPAQSQRRKGSRPDACAKVEQVFRASPHRGTQQNAVRTGPKAVAGLRQSDPPGQKGIARCGLVFYKVIWLV
ncbi:hypothetical protein D3C87_1683370 [compost metagenome]